MIASDLALMIASYSAWMNLSSLALVAVALAAAALAAASDSSLAAASD